MPTTTVQITPKCSQLLITVKGQPVTSLDGRLTGNQVSFLNFTYDDYAMRRKAEVLKHREKDTTTNKSTYSYLSQNGYYSKANLKRFIDQRTVVCNASSSSACSGVIGSNMTYYLNVSVPYYPSI
jgi:hypothetical protein